MKIALLGSAPSSVALAPFQDASFDQFLGGTPQPQFPPSEFINDRWEIWACSPGAFAHAPRADRWFELHRWEPGKPWFSPQYVQFLREFRGIVYTGGPVEELANGVVYPLAEIEAEFSSYFLNSSLSLMLALAIREIEQARAAEAPKVATAASVKAWLDAREDTIGLWGVDMAANEEWCVAPETRVLTRDLRWVPASEIAVGDEVIAFDEEAGGGADSPCAYRQWRVAQVLGAEVITRPCYRLHMADGTQLVSSTEHRWLTYSEHEHKWRKTGDMVTSHHRADRPTKIVKLVNTWEEDNSWDAGYLAAAFDGEGWLMQNDRAKSYGTCIQLGFAQRENAMSEAVFQICRKMGFELRFSGNGGQNGDCAKHMVGNGRSSIMELLGRVRPRRLLAKFDASMLGVMHRKDAVAVERAEYLGEQPVVALKTSTGTFVAEGFASHNSSQRPGCHFFILEALRRGIGIQVPKESCLLRPMPVYGISEWDHNYVKATARMKELSGEQKQLEQQMSESSLRAHYLAGARDNMNYYINTWFSPYGIPAGCRIQIEPGTGLGGGMTMRTPQALEQPAYAATEGYTGTLTGDSLRFDTTTPEYQRLVAPAPEQPGLGLQRAIVIDPKPAKKAKRSRK